MMSAVIVRNGRHIVTQLLQRFGVAGQRLGKQAVFAAECGLDTAGTHIQCLFDLFHGAAMVALLPEQTHGLVESGFAIIACVSGHTTIHRRLVLNSHSSVACAAIQ